MNYCKKCGSVIPEGQSKCPNCYTDSSIQIEEKLKEIGSQVKMTAGDVLQSAPDHTAEFETSDIQSNLTMAILSYLSWLCLVPIFFAKESPYARFHANQGLILTLLSMCALFVVGVIGAVLPELFILKLIVKLIRTIVNLAIFAFEILGIYNAATRKAKELPLIGGFRILK